MNTVSIPTIIIVSLLALITIGLFSTIVTLLYLNLAETKKKRRLDEIKFFSKVYNSNTEVYELVDKYINGILGEYLIFHPELGEKTVFTDADQKELAISVIEELEKTIPVAMVQHLKLLFNESNLEDILYKRVIIAVTEFSINHNGEAIGAE